MPNTILSYHKNYIQKGSIHVNKERRGYEERNSGRVNTPHFPKPPLPDGNAGRNNPPSYTKPPEPKK